jgi:hypothetical protein
MAGADLKLLQTAMGHASITVTANTYAGLFDDELDNIAAARARWMTFRQTEAGCAAPSGPIEQSFGAAIGTESTP